MMLLDRISPVRLTGEQPEPFVYLELPQGYYPGDLSSGSAPDSLHTSPRLTRWIRTTL
jgi:hypothetical protein